MSMNAKLVQIDPAELQRLQADPSRAEMLFEDDASDASLPPAFVALAKTMHERIRAAGPQQMAEALSRFPPTLRKQIEDSMRRTNAALAGGKGADTMRKLMEPPRDRSARVSERTVLSLDKAWHGVHYVLCGEVEPGTTLLSQAVLGGTELGDDDEGFSGYGPARYFTSAQVTELAQALSRPELEPEAAARFDAMRMSELKIYPGWRSSDADWVMDAFRSLRDFYVDAASKGKSVVTCLM
jgi:hypothetical protein